MNWIRNFVTPKLKALMAKDIPENMWHKCPDCAQMIFYRELNDSQGVCQNCQFHFKIRPIQRFDTLFDDQFYQRITLPSVNQDPIKFRDLKKYPDRLKDARHKTGEDDALIVVTGDIMNKPAVVACLDFEFMAGSMGLAVGAGLVHAAQQAIKRNAALIIFTASGGARMQEGILSLMQMARITIAINQLKDHGLPYIVVLTNPTSGGVTASFAMIGDIHIAEPRATICFAGRRVIELTMKQKLPDEFQTSEYLLKRGMIDRVVHRRDLRHEIGTLLGHLMSNITPSTLLAIG